MGRAERAHNDLNRLLGWFEHGWKPCLPPAANCYCCVPHFMDMRLGVLVICIWQILSGTAWVLLIQFLFNTNGKGATSGPFSDFINISYNMISIIMSDLLEDWVHYFDLGFAGATVVMGILGLIAVTDADGIMHYTDRAIVKIVVYSRGCIVMALLSLLRLAVGLLAYFFTAAYILPWWWVVGIAAFSTYHAYVVWSFFAVLKRQYKGIFNGVPVMRGQAPPGVVVELTHFQEVDMVLQDVSAVTYQERRSGFPVDDVARVVGQPTASLVADQEANGPLDVPKFLLFPNPSLSMFEAQRQLPRVLTFETD
mmetsp:Transcript_29295/g.82638  ORF Transcript_29295/g.82638 Transcript_29295/m.82638 type:complete len:310 (+) Transcript_29295:270-1199(+)